jgi:hypothetical protein
MIIIGNANYLELGITCVTNYLTNKTYIRFA